MALVRVGRPRIEQGEPCYVAFGVANAASTRFAFRLSKEWEHFDDATQTWRPAKLRVGGRTEELPLPVDAGKEGWREYRFMGEEFLDRPGRCRVRRVPDVACVVVGGYEVRMSSSLADPEDAERRLFQAIADNDVPVVTDLLRNHPHVIAARDENGVSPLLAALYRRRGGILGVLLQREPELDAAEAAALGVLEPLRELLREDPARANAVQPDGFTPLHLACFFGQLEAAEVLLDAGADPNRGAANPSRVRPLHSAAASRRADLVELLLGRGADANARQQGGWTALHSAAQHGDARMARACLAHGADARQAADDGRTPRELAAAAGHAELVALLDAA